MKCLIEFPLEDGNFVLVEVDEPEPEDGVVKAARPGEIAAKASKTLEAALEGVRPAVGAVISKLRNLADPPPDEMEVEFGVKLSADAGAFLASAGAEANYTVTLTWKREEEKENKE